MQKSVILQENLTEMMLTHLLTPHLWVTDTKRCLLYDLLSRLMDLQETVGQPRALSFSEPTMAYDAIYESTCSLPLGEGLNLELDLIFYLDMASCGSDWTQQESLFFRSYLESLESKDIWVCADLCLKLDWSPPSPSEPGHNLSPVQVIFFPGEWGVSRQDWSIYHQMRDYRAILRPRLKYKCAKVIPQIDRLLDVVFRFHSLLETFQPHRHWVSNVVR